MKKRRKSNNAIFKRAGIAYTIVYIKRYNSYKDLTSFKSLVTLNTLKILESYGPTFKNFMD